ncbi:MAG: sulfotransferase [Ilumatobacter sp.]
MTDHEPPLDSARLVFIGGLHRSGTTALGRMLAAHPSVSGFEDTDAEEDEGQHLQSVYAPAIRHGGPGRFAKSSAAHLTELDGADADSARRGLTEAWRPYWDLERPVLVEKSPPNMIMGRYLESIFPGSALVVIVRHPIVVALSTKKWAPRTSLSQLVEHWFVAHDLLRADAQRLDRLHVLRYEDLIAEPDSTLASVAEFIGLDGTVDPGLLDASRSSRYLDTWAAMTDGGYLDQRRHTKILDRYGSRIEEWGYSGTDLTERADWSFQGLR